MSGNRAVLLFMLVLACPSSGRASITREGTAGFVVELYASPRTDKNGLWGVTAKAFSDQHSKDTAATLRIEVGKSAAVADGETVQTVYPARRARIQLRMRTVSDGPLRIVGSLRIPGDNPTSYDYTETVMELDVRGDSISVLQSWVNQAVAVRNGNRFRYGGEYLVAIDDNEIDPPRQYLSRARVIRSESITCHNCADVDTLEVPIVVTVGRNGTVAWVRPGRLDNIKISDKVWSAIADGVKRWEFRAAMSPRGPVADYLVLKVPVVSTP